MSKNKVCGSYMITFLPHEILINILYYVGNIKDIVSFCSSTKYIKSDVEDNKILSKFIPNFRVTLTYKCYRYFQKIGMQLPVNLTLLNPIIPENLIFQLSLENMVSIKSICVSTSGLIIALFNNTLSIWCNFTYKCLKIFKTKEIISSLCCLPNNRLAVAIKYIFIINLNTLGIEKILRGHRNTVTSMISYGNKLLSISSIDGRLRLWDLEIRQYTDSVFYSGNNLILCSASCCQNCEHFVILDNKGDQTSSIYRSSHSRIISLNRSLECICKFNNIIVGGSKNEFIFFYGNNGLSIPINNGHTLPLTCLIQYNSSNILISASDDCSIKVWSIKEKCICIRTIRVHTNPVKGLAIDSNGNIVSISEDGCICITSLSERLKMDDIQKTS
jgi:WD40 repeat protein